MMREIKFRFWDGTTGNKAMCYMTEHGMIRYPSSGFEITLALAIEEANEDEGYNAPKALMQYTGLKDKNGAEIYEGDWLNYTGETFREPFEVFWSDRLSAFMIRNQSRTWSEYMTDRDLSNHEVIGNIYEHPELLTRGKS